MLCCSHFKQDAAISLEQKHHQQSDHDTGSRSVANVQGWVKETGGKYSTGTGEKICQYLGEDHHFLQQRSGDRVPFPAEGVENLFVEAGRERYRCGHVHLSPRELVAVLSRFIESAFLLLPREVKRKT